MIKRRWTLIAPLLCAVVGLAGEPPPTPLTTRSAGELVRILNSGAGREEKADACRELAVIGSGSAVPPLARLLADKDLSHMALYALETMPGADVNKTLRGELTKLDGRRLIGVIGTLAVRKDNKAVKPLTHLLGSSDAGVAEAAARALGRIGTADAARGILARLPTAPPVRRPAFFEGCLRCAESVAAEGKTGQAVAIYNQLRRETDLPGAVRIAALRGAILAGGANGLGLLEESLESPNYAVFSAAVQASEELPSAEVTRALAESLSLVSAENRVVLVQALGGRADAAALPRLRRLVNDDPDARPGALRALAAIGGPVAVTVMVENIASSDSAVSRTAVECLAGIPGREADAAAVPMLADKDAARRLIGIELVGRRRMTDQVPALIKLSADSDDKVRRAGLRSIGELGSREDVRTLIGLVLRATEKSDCDAGAEALETVLGRSGTPESATTQIVNAMAQSQINQKCAFLSVLSSIGGTKALPAVRAALADPDAEVRGAALHALADWADPSAETDLLKALRSMSENNEREVAFRGYVRLADEPVNPDAKKLKMLSAAAALAAGPQDQKLVLSGLGEVISVESLRLVAARLSNPLLADEAAAAAIKIASKLGASYMADIGPVLNLVLKTAKSERLLDQARKCMKQFTSSRKLN